MKNLDENLEATLNDMIKQGEEFNFILSYFFYSTNKEQQTTRAYLEYVDKILDTYNKLKKRTDFGDFKKKYYAIKHNLGRV